MRKSYPQPLGGTIMSNFIFVGGLAILTEDVSKRGFAAVDGIEATIKSTTFEIVEKNGFTRITAKEAVTNAGHKWTEYPECFCGIVTKEKLTREEMKKLILASSFSGSALRFFRNKESMYLDALNTPPVFINKRGEVESYNGTIIKY